jgi:hypothetical protein
MARRCRQRRPTSSVGIRESKRDKTPEPPFYLSGPSSSNSLDSLVYRSFGVSSMLLFRSPVRRQEKSPWRDCAVSTAQAASLSELTYGFGDRYSAGLEARRR